MPDGDVKFVSETGGRLVGVILTCLLSLVSWWDFLHCHYEGFCCNLHNSVGNHYFPWWKSFQSSNYILKSTKFSDTLQIPFSLHVTISVSNGKKVTIKTVESD